MKDVVSLSRVITTHQTNPCNEAIELRCGERDDVDGCRLYRARLPDGRMFVIDFQNGPIKEVGTNGLTLEVMLAIVIDQLETHQTTKYANTFNAAALLHARGALAQLIDRTRVREARGVEGTHEV